MSDRDLAAEFDVLRTRQAQLERCLAALQEAVTEITDELDPPPREGRDLMRVFGTKVGPCWTRAAAPWRETTGAWRTPNSIQPVEPSRLTKRTGTPPGPFAPVRMRGIHHTGLHS